MRHFTDPRALVTHQGQGQDGKHEMFVSIDRGGQIETKHVRVDGDTSLWHAYSEAFRAVAKAE